MYNWIVKCEKANDQWGQKIFTAKIRLYSDI